MFNAYKDLRHGMYHIWCPHCKVGISFMGAQPLTCINCRKPLNVRVEFLIRSPVVRMVHYREGSKM